MVLEIKSVSSFVYRAIEATERPMPNHILQCFHYVKGLEKTLGVSQGNIVYICKDDCMIAEVSRAKHSQLQESEKEMNKMKDITFESPFDPKWEIELEQIAEIFKIIKRKENLKRKVSDAIILQN